MRVRFRSETWAAPTPTSFFVRMKYFNAWEAKKSVRSHFLARSHQIYDLPYLPVNDEPKISIVVYIVLAWLLSVILRSIILVCSEVKGWLPSPQNNTGRYFKNTGAIEFFTSLVNKHGRYVRSASANTALELCVIAHVGVHEVMYPTKFLRLDFVLQAEDKYISRYASIRKEGWTDLIWSVYQLCCLQQKRMQEWY